MNGRVCWFVDAGRPLTSCCFLPSHPNVVAACGRGGGLTVFDTTSPAPSHCQLLVDCTTVPLIIDPTPLRQATTAIMALALRQVNSVGRFALSICRVYQQYLFC